MSFSRVLRRSLISVAALCFYLAVVYLTGVSTRLTTMAQFFGHALIYGAGVALVSALLFVIERSAAYKKEGALVPGRNELEPSHPGKSLIIR